MMMWLQVEQRKAFMSNIYLMRINKSLNGPRHKTNK